MTVNKPSTQLSISIVVSSHKAPILLQMPVKQGAGVLNPLAFCLALRMLTDHVHDPLLDVALVLILDRSLFDLSAPDPSWFETGNTAHPKGCTISGTPNTTVARNRI